MEALLRAVGDHHQHREVTWHDEFHLPDLGVRPDYAIRANGEITGYIELKKPGLSVDPETFGKANREQWEKLRDLPNLLYSNGTEWRIFRHGEQVGETVFFRGALKTAGQKLEPVEAAAFDALLKQFLRWTPAHITQVPRLVQHVAPLCRLLRSAVMEQLAFEARSSAAEEDTRARPFTGLKNDWRRLLFPSADDATFADGYSQTVTFALLLARAEGIPLAPNSFHEIGRRLDAGHALIGKALQLLTDNVNERFTVTLDLLTRTIARVDWPTIRSGNRDAYLHLYEHFLTVYDPALRQQSGSYYTPHEIVEEMVRLTEDVLRVRLDQEAGFGSEEVKIIDPAMGTGTFLHTIIERVAEQAVADHGPAMARDAISRLATRLFGFELQMGPFAVAELRASDLLKRYHAALPGDGLNFFVTDTLDNPFVEDEYLASTYGALSAFRRRANRVKRNIPVTAVVMNPPYDDKAEGRGGWVEKRAQGQEPPLLDAFRHQGNGRYEHVLKNMHVYFWRWATWKVFDAHPDDRHGVVCLITPSGWATGPGGRGMRDYLRRTCDEGWIIDLTPEGQRSPVPNRVFPGVAQPLAIHIFVRRADTQRGPTHRARVHYRAVSGKRADKFRQLKEIHLDDEGWRDAHDEGVSPFTPATRSGWDEFPALNDLFPWGSPGSKANRSWVSAPSAETLRRRWARMVRETDPMAKAGLFKETRDRTLASRTRQLTGQSRATSPIEQEVTTTPHLVRVALRSFDRQHLIADNRVLDYPRPDLWASLQPLQIFLNQQASHAIDSGAAVVATHLLPDTHHFNGRGGRIMPLLHPDGSPNTASGLLSSLAGLLGAERITVHDLAAYVMAVAGHGAFTERFTEELLTPGVRLPLTREREFWDTGVALGREVLWASTYGERYVDAAAGRPAKNVLFARADERRVRYLTHVGGTMPDRIRHDPATQTLYVGEGVFAPVPEAVWRYDVGGMGVVNKWFGYRKASPTSKKTSPLDDIHVESWPHEWTTELMELLSVLRRLVDVAAAQEVLLGEILDGRLIAETDLMEAGVLPITTAARKARHPAADGLFSAGEIAT
ncbi:MULTISPECIES: type ISP restriction/modification enzyme [Streptomyces]|uniref:site-specific DNA-methyltransferase (adenine-specific) n=1 Tax=Streptomyces scabiei (strain 87.22) TaxID=680198 RepID=C9ZD15_STRSW|nr:type ISP restriction/modification enzyme [Streptomyces scabiei]KFG10824.1 DNA methyltransferase [Streptomyces scabiei]MDX2532537.1 N-6 DNA methylase [Streptomyces scabiei]MDX2579439.1 N-6 DNA methylase [Streptomyces scabiei]MDX2658233.1 N-6 DNA methylase [Streptomyces scabiei]MDX2725245.1 N-6 DNA methylase [Streptomyces scabiei]